jgi:hypothetical protein
MLQRVCTLHSKHGLSSLHSSMHDVMPDREVGRVVSRPRHIERTTDLNRALMNKLCASVPATDGVMGG